MESQTPTPPAQATETTPVAAPPPPDSSPSPALTPPPTQTPSGKKNMNILPLIALCIIVIGFVLLALWYIQAQPKKEAVQAVTPEQAIDVTPKKIVVGIDPTYPPMEF